MVGYGILFLLLCSCVPVLSQSQATPKATVIRQPVKIGGRSTIGCSLLGSNHVGCRSMYWVANGTVLHDGLGYNMTFLQSYCLGHLTFYAYSPAEIRCLIELISGNATALNSTSGIVIIRVPNEIGRAVNASTTDDTGLHDSSNSSESKGTDRSTRTPPVDDMMGLQSGNDFKGSGFGTETADLTTEGVLDNEDSDGQTNVAYIAVPVVVLVISVFLGTVFVVICCVKRGRCCCCRGTPTYRRELTRNEKANHHDEQQKEKEVEGKTETTDAGGVQATDEENIQNKFVVPRGRVSATAGDLTAKIESPPPRRHQGRHANHRSPQEIVEVDTFDEALQRPDSLEMHELLPLNQVSYSDDFGISHPLGTNSSIETFLTITEGSPTSPGEIGMTLMK